MFCRADAVVCQSSPHSSISAAQPDLRNAISPRSPGNNRIHLFLPEKLLHPLAPSPVGSPRRPTRRRQGSPMFPFSPSLIPHDKRTAEDGKGDHHLSPLPRPSPAHPPSPPLPHPRHGLTLPDASTISGPGGGTGSRLLLVLNRVLTDEEQYCRKRAQVQRKGMEADILLLSPPRRRRLSPSSSGPGTSCCCIHPVQSSSGHQISSLPLRYA